MAGRKYPQRGQTPKIYIFFIYCKTVYLRVLKEAKNQFGLLFENKNLLWLLH